MFDPVEETLNQVAWAIDPAREREALLAIRVCRDVGPGFFRGGDSADGIAVIAFVAEQRRSFRHDFQQSFGLLTVVDLTACQPQCEETTVSVNKGMDLAREAASGASHAAICGSPSLPVALCWWTRTQVESIMTMSPS